MNNTFLTPEIVAKEALMVLTGNLVMADLVHRDYSEEFVGVGDTVTIRKPAKFVARNFTGQAEAQDITEGSVSVKLDRFRDVTVAVTSKQMSLDIADFSAQVVEPAMQAIAQAIDEDLLAVALSKAGFKREGTQEATDLADIAALAKQLDIKKAPVAGRSLVLHPEHKYRYALTENLSNVSFAGDNETLRDALLAAAVYDQKILVEEFIHGREIEVAVMGNENPVASICGEIDSGADFYDYDAKYVTDTSTAYIPARIPEDVQEIVREAAVKVYSAIGCQGLSRVDFFVTFDENRVVFNEINTLPGFTSISMYPKLFAASGIPYSQLIDELLRLAVEAFA